MPNTLIVKIIDWLCPPKSLDKEINKTMDDIAFLNRKIVQAKNMFCDVIAEKLVLQRNRMITKYAELLERRRHLFK